MLGFLIGLSAAWALLGGVYLVFVGQVSADELATAAACGLAGGLWAAAIGRAATLRFRWSRRALGALARGAAGVPSGAAKVAAWLVQALFGRARGGISQTPFAHGRRDDPTAAGWRAGAVLGRSMAPDSFVVRAPEGRDLLELHVFGKTKQ